MNLKFSRLRLPAIVLPLLFCSLSMKAQTSALDQYIEEGLKSNLVIQQKNIDVKKAWYSLKNAGSLFLPTVSLQGTYQTGAGGRSISLPVGDLMNPVYTTLNKLTGSEKFPQINNVEQDFLASNFYDAKIRTTIPIINTDLKYNEKIQQQEVAFKELEVEGFKLELVKKIKVAYYSYCSALKVVGVYESALVLANENLRINERLLKNGKGLPSYVLRSQSEQENTRAKITEARKSAENAKLYFNFLINRDSESSINVFSPLTEEFNKAVSLLLADADVSGRPELNALKELVKLNSIVIRMNENYRKPKISGFVDIGSQAERFRVDATSTYYNAGVQLEIPLFNGHRNTIKIEQARLDKQKAELNLNYTAQQLSLSATSIKNNLTAVYQSYISALKSAESAASYQRLIERGFKEGINTFIEDIDGRNLLTAAQLHVNINYYNVLITAANLEAETGLPKL